MKKTIKFLVLILLFGSSKIFASKDSLRFEANDAIRFAKFKDFYKFGESWTASEDTSGKFWVVKASRSYRSRRIIKNTDLIQYCTEPQGCLVESSRIIIMDKYTGKVLKRKRYIKITN